MPELELWMLSTVTRNNSSVMSPTVILHINAKCKEVFSSFVWFYRFASAMF